MTNKRKWINKLNSDNLSNPNKTLNNSIQNRHFESLHLSTNEVNEDDMISLSSSPNAKDYNQEVSDIIKMCENQNNEKFAEII